MRQIKVLAVLFALLPGIAAAQPANLPANSVWGRLALPTQGGPGEAIPFAILFANAGLAAGPQSCSSHNWFNSLNAGGGLGCAQPSFADLSSTIAASQLIPPTGTTLGGVQSKDCSSGGGFVQKINTDGTETCATPAGGGTVTTTGSPTAHQTAVVSGATSITGVGPSSVGQSLTSNGASADPSYQSGGWTLLATLTASNSASLSDTTHVTSSYNEYLIVIESLLPATTATTCELQVHSSGSFQATGYLSSMLFGSGTSTGSQAATTFIQCGVATSGLNAGLGVTGEIMFFNPSASSIHAFKGETIQSSTSSTALNSLIGGYWTTSGVIDGFQLISSSGNWTSGSVKLYGRL